MALGRTNQEITQQLIMVPEESPMPFKILVADDNINDKFDEISRLPEMLKAAGYEIVATADGVGVYDLVLESRPDLVVLDIQFKRQPVNGFEICEAIRGNDPDILPPTFEPRPISHFESHHSFGNGGSCFLNPGFQ